MRKELKKRYILYTRRKFFMFCSVWVFIVVILRLSAQQLAFPSAEGFGRYASGGRGGDVYHVTNLNDSGEGSFRDAVSVRDRTVVFDVGGVIEIEDRIVISRNVTVAGQTAPGGGITIYGNGIALNGDSGNDIIRYIRIRMGVNGDSKKDAVGISENTDYMFDHVSVSWGRDGTVDINGSGIDNVTLQDCIIAQGLDTHSTGGLMQAGRFSLIRNLFIDNHTRNPKGRGTHEVVNNVVYNWRVSGYILGDTEGLSEANIIGNYFVKGPSTSSEPFNRSTEAFHAYVSDNWCDEDCDGVLNGASVDESAYGSATLMDVPYDYPGVSEVLSAPDALQYVAEHAGASIVRDEVDEYLIEELRSYGTSGAIIADESENGITDNVGTVENGTVPVDTDQDGMPDYWEEENGLDINDASDRNGDLDGDGYTNLEEYLEEIIETQDTIQIEDCAGVMDGTAFVDKCGECVRGTTGKEPCKQDCNGDWGGEAYLDECGVCVGGETGLDHCTGSIEGEGASSYEGVIESDNTGYTGDGYLNYSNVTGVSATWSICSNSSLTSEIMIRYSNGSGSERNLTISVNGTEQIAELTIPATSSWTTWETVSAELAFQEGENLVSMAALSEEGGPNIDIITFSDENLYDCETGIKAGKNPLLRTKRIGYAKGKLSFYLQQEGDVEISIYNISGRKLKSLFNGKAGRGYNSVCFDPSELNAGMYIFVLKTGNSIMKKKVLEM